MINYDKDFIKEQITDEDVFNLLQDFGGNPIDNGKAFISDTICHNEPGVGSHKLYYYKVNKMCYCYTGCSEPSFDIFELTRKVFRIQKNKELDFNDAIRWVAQRLNIIVQLDNIDPEDDILEDWHYLDNYNRIQEIELSTNNIVLKEYDETILKRFNYDIAITPWLREGISQKAIQNNQIGYYPGEEQITIPHFDINNKLIGIRGRSLIEEEANKYGKYRPLKINGALYNHPLSMNLYNLNNSKNNIQIMKTAILFESEKSTLLYQSFFGQENDISVAVCGSAVSEFQINLLIQNGVREIVLAFDRDFEELGDDRFKRLKNKVSNLSKKYCNDVIISIIWDKEKITGLKSSPIDEGPDKFLQLFKERIIL